jgi:small subunit ribosomal protein S29
MFINPLDLTEDNVSQIYCVPTEDVKTAFPTSLPRRFTAQVDAFGHTCWLLRRQSYEIMKELKEYDSTQPQMFRYLLYGSDGSGKTLCLHQVLHHCLKAGWLVVFIPSVFSWTHSRQELRPSAHHPGTFDQPEAAVTWLKTFRTLNSHLTAQMHISRDWEWGKKDYSSAGEDLNNVIDKGLLKPVIATEVVSAVLQELVLASDR